MHDVPMGATGRGHQVPEPLSSIRGTWGDGLGPSIAAVVVLYWSFVGLHLALDGDVGRRLAWVDGLSGVAAGVALGLLLLLRPGHTGRLVIGVGLGTVAGANALAHVAVEQDLARSDGGPRGVERALGGPALPMLERGESLEPDRCEKGEREGEALTCKNPFGKRHISQQL